MIPPFLGYPTFLLFLSAAWVQASPVFQETFDSGYDQGPLAGQNGWEAWEKSPSSPVVADTMGKRHPDFNWAVTCKASSSSDDYAVKVIPAPQLRPDGKIVVEITATREFHPRGAGNGVTFGFGTKVMDKAIGLGHLGVFFRDGWGGTTHAVDASGSDWNDFGSREVVVLRSVWDLSANTASLSIKNLSLGETEFTPLYFDREQTRTTVDLGPIGDLASWNQFFIRTTGTKGAMLFDAKVSVE
jgi:hypothetical protein